jgi:hypothetical protein
MFEWRTEFNQKPWNPFPGGARLEVSSSVKGRILTHPLHAASETFNPLRCSGQIVGAFPPHETFDGLVFRQSQLVVKLGRVAVSILGPLPELAGVVRTRE